MIVLVNSLRCDPLPLIFDASLALMAIIPCTSSTGWLSYKCIRVCNHTSCPGSTKIRRADGCIADLLLVTTLSNFHGKNLLCARLAVPV